VDETLDVGGPKSSENSLEVRKCRYEGDNGSSTWERNWVSSDAWGVARVSVREIGVPGGSSRVVKADGSGTASVVRTIELDTEEERRTDAPETPAPGLVTTISANATARTTTGQRITKTETRALNELDRSPATL
jgi:hypothetical protein